MANDPSTQLMVPAVKAFVMNGDDGNDIPQDVTRAIHLSSAAQSVRVTLLGMNDGDWVDLYLLQGVTYAYQVKRLWATGSAGATLIGLA